MKYGDLDMTQINDGLTQTAACDLGGYNVRVNAVCPGLVETGMTRKVFEYARSNEKEHKLGSRCELRRYGRPEELAAAICFRWPSTQRASA